MERVKEGDYEGFFQAMEKAEEPCVELQVVAHGKHAEQTGNEIETLLVPVSVIEKLMVDWRPDYGHPAPEKVDAISKALEAPQGEWLVYRDFIYFSPEVLQKNPERHQFQALLRARLQQIGDRLQEMWDERYKEVKPSGNG